MSTSLYVYLLRSEVISSLGASTNNLGTYAAKGYVFISRSDGGYHTNKILGGVTAFYGFVISPGGDTPPEIRGYGLRFRQNSCSIARYNEALSLYQRLHTLWQGTTSGTG